MNKEQLLGLIEKSEQKLNALRVLEYDAAEEAITDLESAFHEFREGGNTLLEEAEVLQIGIVGQVKAGKSSFLNSLFFNGESVLPKASTPMTAGLTIIEYATTNTFEVEYFSEADWDIFVKQNEIYLKIEQEVRDAHKDAPEMIIKKEIENRTTTKMRSAHEMLSACSLEAKCKIGTANDTKSFSDITDLQNVLEQFVGANGQYTSVVKSLRIRMNDRRLTGLRIVDTPGVNDPVVSRENRTRTFLHACHGVFLLSSSSDFLGDGDIGFLNSRIGASGISAVVLLASKFDSVLQDIGADFEMKQQKGVSLSNVIEVQTEKFKNRLNEQSKAIDEKLRGRIKLDVTAGIGYSIAHKPMEQWDDVEKQVVQQMKRYYPDFFDSEQMLRENFAALANIEGIREQYLDNEFKNNKDAIIADKVRDYFVKNKQSISSMLADILSTFEVRYEQLNNTTIAEIQKQKEVQSKLFKDLEEEFSSILTKFKRELQSSVKGFSNQLVFNSIKRIPTERVEEELLRKRRGFTSLFWETKPQTFTFEQVNTYQLGIELEQAVIDYCDAWNKLWRELFEKVQHQMSEEMIRTIKDFEKGIKSKVFDARYYSGLINKTIIDLSNHKQLEVSQVISRYREEVIRCSRKQFEPIGTENMEENEVKNYLRIAFNKHIENLSIEINNLAIPLEKDLTRVTENEFAPAIEMIGELEDNFVIKLTEEGMIYLNTLEKDMSYKMEAVDKVRLVIDNLKELSNLYK